MLQGGWRIGSVGGVDIRVDPSWIVVAILITYSLWLQFADPLSFPGLGTAAATALAILAAALFFASVLAHELAHAGMSKLRGIPVHGITLFMFGGATHASMEAKKPVDEFLVTVVGPGTSLALGGIFLAAHALGRALLPHPLTALFGYLAWVNLVLAAFNLVPGFPLDGGRILRSAIWRLTGSLARATRIAARVGQLVGLLIAAYGVRVMLDREGLNGLWLIVIGWFLFQAASASAADGARRRLLEATTVSDVMSPPPPTIPADLRAGDAIEGFLSGHDGEAFPVVDATGVVGLATLATATAVAPDRPMREAVMGVHGTVQAEPEERMDAVVDRLGRGQARTVLVMESGRLVGVIEPGDLASRLKTTH